MQLHCQPRRGNRLWWVSTDKSSDRDTIAAVQKRITKLQRQHGVRPYNATIFETGRGGLHAHTTFIGNREIADRLKASKQFGELIHVAPVTDPQGLLKYLAKERTPQAGYLRNHVLGGRLRGSHKLDGGGDRVRLSRDLERDAIDAGYVQDWRRTNAKRSPKRKSYAPRSNQNLRKTAPRPAGQLPLLKLKPVSRLRHFGRGLVPPSVASEIQFLRRQRGLSQQELGKMIGCSQGQLANALRGHDPISKAVVNRLREVLLTGPLSSAVSPVEALQNAIKSND